MAIDIKQFFEQGLRGVSDRFAGITPQDRFKMELERLKEEQAIREHEASQLWKSREMNDESSWRKAQEELARDRETNLNERFNKSEARDILRDETAERRHQEALKAREAEREDEQSFRAEQNRLQREFQEQLTSGSQAFRRELAKLQEGDLDERQSLIVREAMKASKDALGEFDPEMFRRAKELLEKELPMREGKAKAQEEADDPNASEDERVQSLVEKNNFEAEQAMLKRGIEVSSRGYEGGAPNEGPPTLGLEGEITTDAADNAANESSAIQEFSKAVELAASGQDGTQLQRILDTLDQKDLSAVSPQLLDKLRDIYRQSLRSEAPF